MKNFLLYFGLFLAINLHLFADIIYTCIDGDQTSIVLTLNGQGYISGFQFFSENEDGFNLGPDQLALNEGKKLFHVMGKLLKHSSYESFTATFVFPKGAMIREQPAFLRLSRRDEQSPMLAERYLCDASSDSSSIPGLSINEKDATTLY
jgi:hypothetical protein